MSLGRWIFKNYQDALSRIRTEQPQLEALCKSCNLKLDDLKRFLEEERVYLNGLHRGGDGDIISISAEYVQLVNKLASAQ
jgi:hypothetical protein